MKYSSSSLFRLPFLLRMTLLEVFSLVPEVEEGKHFQLQKLYISFLANKLIAQLNPTFVRLFEILTLLFIFLLILFASLILLL